MNETHQRLPFPTAIIREFTRIVPVNSPWWSGANKHNRSDSLRTHYCRWEEFSMAEIAGTGQILDFTNDIIATETQQLSILCWAISFCWLKKNRALLLIDQLLCAWINKCSLLQSSHCGMAEMRPVERKRWGASQLLFGKNWSNALGTNVASQRGPWQAK